MFALHLDLRLLSEEKCDEGYEQLLAASIRDTFAFEVVCTVTNSGMVIVYVPRDEGDNVAMSLSAELAELVGE